MQMSPKSTRLPSLAFGEGRAYRAADRYQAAAVAAQVLGDIDIYEPAADTASFQHKFSTICVNGLELAAAASSPMKLGIKTPNETFLLVPFFGSTTLHIGKREYQWGAGERALFIQNCNYRYGVTETRSVMIARIDLGKLRDTISSMVGDEGMRETELCPEEARLLNLQQNSIDFTVSFRHLCGFIDSLAASPATLEKMGVDDWFYRLLSCWLVPELLGGSQPEQETSRCFAPSAIDAVCEAIRSRPTKPLTKTEMEKISGLSARGLQYAFLKKYDCAPLEWQKRERLHIAYERLRMAHEEISVTELSLELGFSSPSRFAEYYKSQFGESPQETKKRRNRHHSSS